METYWNKVVMAQTNDLSQLMAQLGHSFHDEHLLEIALTHRSMGRENNERLEFLGDAILALIVSAELYYRHPQASEGDLSRLRASVVNGDVLSEIARDLNISAYLRLGPGERKSGGEMRASILTDTLEAIVGAIYIDAGLEVSKHCIFQWYGERVIDWAQLQSRKDSKSQLQEWLQARQLPLPDYRVTVSGQAHAQTFTVTCQVSGLPYTATGMGSTRRRAEQEAATRFLEQLNG
jgi:ribonuclease-3